MTNRNDSQKKIMKAKKLHKTYNTKKNYITKTLGKPYTPQKKGGK